MGRLSTRAGKGSGRALLDGAVACECDLLFVVVERVSGGQLGGAMMIEPL